ncbi:MAG: hypothetical protein BA872_08610 [Desulfobacterales bacterium C00003060]|nr:MAG: hypothetical protein BA861_12425 [Desulfobacterales bacterium S3730MH5]OEU81722.1 MAG: hypothetical protein BA872_08610 [Desulfobacterales bacterium C00003060]OEU84821.1 MAG: hypothetical protein BA865_04685 [Desulfobacterales bacterium S5133MH4]
MKIKKEYLVLITIIAALSLYLVLHNPDRTHYKLPEVPDIVGADISKIEISRPDTSIILNKKDDKWYIAPQGYLADTNKVKNMQDVIKALTVTALVSESKNYSRYDLDDVNKITVKAWTDETLKRELDVGKAATSYSHTFVKLADDDRVYHARGNFRAKFDQTVDDLHDKTVLSFDQAEIQEIRITKDKQVMVFVRKDAPVEVSTSQETDAQAPSSPKAETVWQTADGNKADKAQVTRLLSTLSGLSCEEYIHDKKKKNFKSPIYAVQLKDTQEYALSVFAKTDKEAKNYPAISSENDYPFLLPDWQVDNLMKKPDEMLTKSEKS